MAVFDAYAAAVGEAIRLEESLIRLQSLTGWDRDPTVDLIRRLSRTTTDSAQTLVDWLIQHAAQGSRIEWISEPFRMTIVAPDGYHTEVRERSGTNWNGQPSGTGIPPR